MSIVNVIDKNASHELYSGDSDSDSNMVYNVKANGHKKFIENVIYGGDVRLCKCTVVNKGSFFKQTPIMYKPH